MPFVFVGIFEKYKDKWIKIAYCNLVIRDITKLVSNKKEISLVFLFTITKNRCNEKLINQLLKII